MPSAELLRWAGPPPPPFDDGDPHLIDPLEKLPPARRALSRRRAVLGLRLVAGALNVKPRLKRRAGGDPAA